MTQPGKDGRRITLVNRLYIRMLIVFPEVTERLLELTTRFHLEFCLMQRYPLPTTCETSRKSRTETARIITRSDAVALLRLQAILSNAGKEN